MLPSIALLLSSAAMLASATSPTGHDSTLSTNRTLNSTTARPFGKAFHRDAHDFRGGHKHKHNGTFPHLSWNTTRAHGHHNSSSQPFRDIAQEHHRNSSSKFGAPGGLNHSVVPSHDQNETRKTRSRGPVQTTYLPETLYSTESTEPIRSTADPVSHLASTSTHHAQAKTTSKAVHSGTASSTKSAQKTSTLHAHWSKKTAVKTSSSHHSRITSSASYKAFAAHRNATRHEAETTHKAATASKTSTSASSTASLSALAKSALNAHNDLRAKHNATALTWDIELAEAAQTWANKCDFKHGGGVALGSGENIAAYTGAASNVTYAVGLWAAEAALYDYAEPGYADATGHFTQMAWKATTRLGCAQAYCTPLTGPTWSWDAGYFF
ncbi:hypothetical protein JCM1840_007639, partial [Sporobolomyces johnsonii]